MAFSTTKATGQIPEGAVRLPNGDIWYPKGKPKQEAAKTLEPVKTPTAKDVVDAELVKGGEHTCVWCGEKFGTDQLFTDHVTKAHGKQIGEAAEASRQDLEAELAYAHAAARKAEAKTGR